MPLDSICLRALASELSEKLTGMKIDKVQMPERDLLLLSLRAAAKARGCCCLPAWEARGRTSRGKSLKTQRPAHVLYAAAKTHSGCCDSRRYTTEWREGF